MMYYFDFDRTLFDTESFITALLTRLGVPPAGTEHDEVHAAELFASEVASGNLTFAPGELASFVYPDVPEFLRALGNEAMIVTHGNPMLQRMKVESALTGIPRVSALYVGYDRKGPYLAERIAGNATRTLFVDDTLLELESVQEHCPTIALYEMRRDGRAGDGRWPVVRSLLDLP